MPQATPKKADHTALNLQLTQGLREGLFVIAATVGLYLLLSLLTYSSSDPGWSHTAGEGAIVNRGGRAGAWLADLVFYLFGYLAYLLPAGVILSSWQLLTMPNNEPSLKYRNFSIRTAGACLILISGCALASLHFHVGSMPLNAGGILGLVVGSGLLPVFSFVGTTLLLLAVFMASITLATGISWLGIVDRVGELTLTLARQLKLGVLELIAWFQARREQHARQQKVAQRKSKSQSKPRIEPILRKLQSSQRAERERQIPLFDLAPKTELPQLNLLDEAENEQGGYSQAALQAMSRQVELKLNDFGIEVAVVAVHPGPVITRFELQPAPGVKVSKISNLAKDLARALSVVSVRIVEVIPGKSVVGLEIPNEQRELVRLSEILRSQAYDESSSPLTLSLGKDISGHPLVADLSKMPHLLVAGTTGAGKSVAINGMLLSLLYKSTPDDVRLILIDPKMLELSVYADIPHLLTPVVTDMKEAANALRWCVAEMERRYRLMSELGVRNIAGFNRKVKAASDRGKPLPDPLFEPSSELQLTEHPPDLAPLPYIVVIVDEFADMMIVVGKKVEELIARLAQKARAAGIHLILATQRPSVDVITGLIKANIPCRIAFQVSSRVDSRTILDQMGAEQLLGHGDMLFLPPGTAIPERIHGAFVADHEVHKVAACLKGKGEPTYLDEVTKEPDSGVIEVPGLEPLAVEGEEDPLYDQAVAIVTETRKASISYLQRRLKIGYNRAARMIEQMEDCGIVSAVQPNGSREVRAAPAPR